MEMWEEVLQQNVSLVCFKEGCDEIVGLNICTVNSLGDPELHLEKVPFDFFYYKHTMYSSRLYERM